MTDKFQLLAPGGECDAAFPLNPVHDEYSLARIFPLAVQVDGITQLAVLPAHVLHPQLAAQVGSQQAKVTLDNSLRAGSSRGLRLSRTMKPMAR